MPRERLPLEALPTWASLNDATFAGAEVKPVQDKGYGLVALGTHAAAADGDADAVVMIPRGLVLNAEAVEEYAKEDRNFRALLDACGHKSPRHDILLFLLAQLALASRPGERVALHSPWTEYLNFLDDNVPVPTLWTEDDRLYLRGTSLESALNAKMLALTQEFDELREASSKIECWNSAFWTHDTIKSIDWYRVDAWFRSRVLDLPRSGTSLVPCIDMVNHSQYANAYYDETANNEAIIMLRPGESVQGGDEITISYGSEKSPAEMLFSYGFLDDSPGTQSLQLPLEPLPDDPLGRAKSHIFKSSPAVQLKDTRGRIEWTSKFAYLACLNEEDGLEFKVLQASDGGRELRMFWQEEDVTEKSDSFDSLVANHELRDVFRLRVNAMLDQRVQEQLEQISLTAPNSNGTALGDDEVDTDNSKNALRLRCIEKGILERAVSELENQRTKLLDLESVKAYLAAMGTAEDDGDMDQEDSEDDFS